MKGDAELPAQAHGDAISGGEVVVELTRWDVARFNFDLSVRHFSTWAVLLLFAAAFGTAFLLAAGFPDSPSKLLATVLAITLIPTALTLVFLLIGAGISVVLARSSSGVLGTHIYAFEAGGLRERTSANDTLIKWGGAQEVRGIGQALGIKISPVQFHIIPHRCFTSASKHEEFVAAAQRLLASAPR